MTPNPRHEQIAKVCREAVQESYCIASKEFGTDTIISIDAASEPFVVQGVSRPDLIRVLIQDMGEAYVKEQLSVFLEPATPNHFYVIIIGDTEEFSGYTVPVKSKRAAGLS